MKSKICTNLMYAFIVATGMSLISACGKDEEEAAPATTSTNAASATIGNSNFTSAKMSAKTEDFFGEDLITIDYINQAGDSLKFGIEGTATAGQQFNYQLVSQDDNELEFFINYIKADGTEYIPFTGNSGQMTITSHDKTAKIIKGTFNGTLSTFDGKDPITVTNGKFEAKY